jgi:glycosyltransferase involved in cell wall biosynthesis
MADLMHILQVHNKHIHAGGEDVTVETERHMLARHGHTVTQWIVDNSILTTAGLFKQTSIALQSLWSVSVYKKAKQLIRNHDPDIVHVHNTIPLISPSIYAAAHACGLPVVQTLNNYRLICPASPLYRDGRLCEECVDRIFPFPAIRYACYRQRRLQTAFVAATLFLNKLIGTYEKHIDFFIAPNEFTRQKFVEGGFPADRIAVKPHFVLSDFSPGEQPGDYALYAGRLVAHKGFRTLLDAWRLLSPAIPLKIIGNGPLAYLLNEDVPAGVEYCGVIEHREMTRWMRDARLFLFTSEWYEPFGYTIVESFASGRPVIGARIGNIPEMVRDGSSGWLYEPANAEDLARTIRMAWADPVELQRRGQLARKQYEEEYRIEQNYPQLMSIYQQATKYFRKIRTTL